MYIKTNLFNNLFEQKIKFQLFRNTGSYFTNNDILACNMPWKISNRVIINASSSIVFTVCKIRVLEENCILIMKYICKYIFVYIIFLLECGLRCENISMTRYRLLKLVLRYLKNSSWKNFHFGLLLITFFLIMPYMYVISYYYKWLIFPNFLKNYSPN